MQDLLLGTYGQQNSQFLQVLDYIAIRVDRRSPGHSASKSLAIAHAVASARSHSERTNVLPEPSSPLSAIPGAADVESPQVHPTGQMSDFMCRLSM